MSESGGVITDTIHTSGLGVTPFSVLSTFRATGNLFQLPSKTRALGMGKLEANRRKASEDKLRTSRPSQFRARILHQVR